MRSTAPNQNALIEVILETDTGICAGTLIRTPAGDVPVQQLRPGDSVTTADGGTAIVARADMSRAMVQPVAIKTGALGHARPDADIQVTPATLVQLSGWRAQTLYGSPMTNVAAQRLVDGTFAVAKSWRLMDVVNLRFARDQVIYANGVAITA